MLITIRSRDSDRLNLTAECIWRLNSIKTEFCTEYFYLRAHIMCYTVFKHDITQHLWGCAERPQCARTTPFSCAHLKTRCLVVPVWSSECFHTFPSKLPVLFQPCVTAAQGLSVITGTCLIGQKMLVYITVSLLRAGPSTEYVENTAVFSICLAQHLCWMPPPHPTHTHLFPIFIHKSDSQINLEGLFWHL